MAVGRPSSIVVRLFRFNLTRSDIYRILVVIPQRLFGNRCSPEVGVDCARDLTVCQQFIEFVFPRVVFVFGLSRLSVADFAAIVISSGRLIGYNSAKRAVVARVHSVVEVAEVMAQEIACLDHCISFALPAIGVIILLAILIDTGLANAYIIPLITVCYTMY